MHACVHCPEQIIHPLTKLVTRFWFEDPVLSKPIKEDAGPNMDNRLFPRECREAVSPGARGVFNTLSSLSCTRSNYHQSARCLEAEWRRAVKIAAWVCGP